MTEARGTYFDGKSSKAHKAIMRCGGDRITIEDDCGSLLQSVRLSQCRLDPPLGKTGRSMRLPGGAAFETSDNAALAALERSWGKNRMMRFVHGIETRWRTVAVSFFGIVLFVWLFHTYAIPVLAKEIAFSLPTGINTEISRHTMDALDAHFFEPTLLSRERTDGIRKRFQRLLRNLGPDTFRYRLEFRKSPIIGPNAFALPSGTVVMTDELVNLSVDDRELDGILLHEIGHVKGRHALRTIIQNAGIFLVIASLSGDLSEISSTAASLPTVLAHSEYSRAFEREADRFAALSLVRMGEPVEPVQDILRRLSGSAPKYPGESVLSSHPKMEERIAELEAFGRTQNR
jgi:Zn-dependent protease with chaperone function